MSYGTYVTAAYAQEHPAHTDRVVLDSTGDPDPARGERGWLANTAAGADERFPDFARWAADPARDRNGLRLAQRAGLVRPLVLSLADRLDRTPRATSTPHKPFTGNILRQALQQALYSDVNFPWLARLIKAAEDPHTPLALPPGYATPMTDGDAAVFTATQCNDVGRPHDARGYARAVATDRIRHPLTAGQPVTITPCAFWHTEPTGKPVHITSDRPSDILMLQNLRDPVTPYFGALRMRTAPGDRARLVTVDHGGHGAYHANGETCGDRAVTEFLLTGHRPSADLRCTAQPRPASSDRLHASRLSPRPASSASVPLANLADRLRQQDCTGLRDHLSAASLDTHTRARRDTPSHLESARSPAADRTLSRSHPCRSRALSVFLINP